MLEKSIIIQLKEGSEEAFNFLYHKFSPLIKQICYFYVKSNDIAEDLTIETFMKLWNNKKNIDINKNLKYYITQIAHNICRDFLRKSKREKTLYVDIDELERIKPDQIAELEGDIELFEKIEKLIDYESYQMLVYKFVHNLKHREIAQIMGVTTSVIGNKIARALRTLKEKLEIEKETAD